ncbi:saccharopine dehydrogenase family protein [Hyphomonas sp.]|uniref:saccharopine dehydrogenase family protein n=1 Tax=Hyphomonas sp. TaxID=87 RepID=UPI0035661A4E
MDTVLIIGAGAAGSVVAQKCAMDRDTFKHITLASRRIESCEKVAKLCNTPIEIAQVDADNVAEVAALINKVKPDLLINMALPYQDLPIMDACVETGTNYMDTANYEPREIAKFEYSWQWAYQDRFVEKGITAILGCGFDPGVSNIWCAYAQQELFDEIEYIDIVDCNAGDHGKTFATNFNPEINIREVTQDGKYWKDGKWIEIPALSIKCDIDYPEVGPRASYLIYHEEEESLVKNIKGLKQIRFWMTFGPEYIKHLEVFKSIGLIGLKPIKHKGMDIIPMEFLKDLLPVPSSLAEGYTGKTSIGVIIRGKKDGKPMTKMLYNVSDHAETNREVSAQAVSYTTGVPPVSGAKMFFDGIWSGKGVFNVEQFPAKPFLDDVAKRGLPTTIVDLEPGAQDELFAVKTRSSPKASS